MHQAPSVFGGLAGGQDEKRGTPSLDDPCHGERSSTCENHKYNFWCGPASEDRTVTLG